MYSHLKQWGQELMQTLKLCLKQPAATLHIGTVALTPLAAWLRWERWEWITRVEGEHW